jgi:hypothetical protein
MIERHPYSVDITQKRIMHVVSQISTRGDLNSNDILDAEYPFQHENFILPQCKDSLQFKNASILDLFKIFLKKEQSRLAILQEISSLIGGNAINFFIFSQASLFLQIIEDLENYDRLSQDATLDIIFFACVNLNFVPLKEMTLLLVKFESFSNLMELLGNGLRLIAQTSPDWRLTFQKLGLLRILISFLQKLVRNVSNNIQNPEITPKSIEFNTAIDLLCELLRNDSNMELFCSELNCDLFCLLKIDNYAASVTKLLSVYRYNIADVRRFCI